MSLRTFETEWKATLTAILEELTAAQLRKLKSNLDKIPQGQKEDQYKEEFPDIIIQFYGTEGSISVIDKEMKVLPRNDAKVQQPLQRIVEELKKRQKIKATSSSVAATDVNTMAEAVRPSDGSTGVNTMAEGGCTAVRPSAGAEGGCSSEDEMDLK